MAVVMRTPGDDLDLARGFLLTEGLVVSPSDLFDLSQCPSQEGETGPGNVIEALLTNPNKVDLSALSRNVFTSSSCGICGRATLESVFQQFPPIESELTVNLDVTSLKISQFAEAPNSVQARQPRFGKVQHAKTFE